MANFLDYICLLLLYLVHFVSADRDISDIFTVQPGTTNGGCGNLLNTLDAYLEEAINSLDAARLALGLYGAATPDGQRVRRAVSEWFGLREAGDDLNRIIENINLLADYFNVGLDEVDPANTFLFCDSTWLVSQAKTTPAVDYEGDIIMVSGKTVPLNKVPAYASYLAVGTGLTAWYSGTHTSIHGYYFLPRTSGGNYCSNDPGNYGLTSRLIVLQQQGNNQPPVPDGNVYQTLVLCPSSFTNGPASYMAGNAAITEGKSLESVVPSSATLLHEACHVIFGDGPEGFLAEADEEQGTVAEFYTAASCIDKASTAGELARRNPENYVFFIATMYYLFGDTLSDDPDPNSPIQTYWDFSDTPNTVNLQVQR